MAKKIICLHSGNLLEGLFSFIHHKYSKQFLHNNMLFFFFYKGLLTLNPRSHFHFFSSFLFKLSSPFFLSVLTPTPTLKLKLLVYILMLVSLPLKKKTYLTHHLNQLRQSSRVLAVNFFLDDKFLVAGRGVGRVLRQLATQRPVLGWEWRKRVNAAPPPPPPASSPVNPTAVFIPCIVW